MQILYSIMALEVFLCFIFFPLKLLYPGMKIIEDSGMDHASHVSSSIRQIVINEEICEKEFQRHDHNG